MEHTRVSRAKSAYIGETGGTKGCRVRCGGEFEHVSDVTVLSRSPKCCWRDIWPWHCNGLGNGGNIDTLWDFGYHFSLTE
jgi:hypothetical protein